MKIKWALCLSFVAALESGCARQAPFDACCLPAVIPPATACCHESYDLGPEVGGPHPVDFYVGMAVERNPDIQAARSAALALSDVVPQVTALDDPILSSVAYTGSELSPQTLTGRVANSLALTQSLPWLGKLRLDGDIATEDARIALASLVATELRVIERVRLSYYDLYFNQQAVAISRESEKLLKDITDYAEIRYRTGQTSQQDVLLAQVELSQLQDEIVVFEQNIGIAQADISQLLELSPDSTMEALDRVLLPNVPKHLDALYDAAIAQRPELRERLLAIFRDRQSVERAKLDYFPDFDVGLTWNNVTEDGSLSPFANGDDNLGIVVAMNLPVRYRKLSAGVREARHRVAQSVRSYDSARDATLASVRRQIVQARALEKQIAIFENRIIPEAKQTLEVSAADYRVGKVVFVQLIDNWTDLLEFRVQLARLKANLGQTLATLERVVGGTIADEQILAATLPAPEDPTAKPSK
ncbi:TolC family protein [Kolteria novifilia]|uniref:TolC family protein n=1 Tax=Kolteria novifilia TaxID=2527975 RepID=UPI003AF3678D